MLLTWHDYSYYPYERELAAREVGALFDQPSVRETPGGVDLTPGRHGGPVHRLTYFSAAVDGRTVTETSQSRLECTARAGRSRQATRYSVHGLHEYKGKFNPQVVRALLNIFRIQPGARILDPFCGSGTTLVECAHSEVQGFGIDANPFAVFVANAKLHALATPVSELHAAQKRLWRYLDTRNPRQGDDLRVTYLRSWFTPEILSEIERIRAVVEDATGPHAPVFLALTSDLLRDYSLQDPKDLRIRRRKSPLPAEPFLDALSAGCARFLGYLEAAQRVLGTSLPRGIAEVQDAAALSPNRRSFDAVITSPPYAMALPYIDTQRLSLVWLGLADPPDVARLDSELIGSREFRGDARRSAVVSLRDNAERLPEAAARFCRRMQDALSSRDGFRRQAVPALMYRYLASMRNCFRSIGRVVRPGAPFALVVGHNHTILSGVRYDIDTPGHLANLASDEGWIVDEMLPLQTYRRYGYHSSNAIRSETLVILRKT